MTVESPLMAKAKMSENAIDTTKAIPNPTDHLPERDCGMKFKIYFHNKN